MFNFTRSARFKSCSPSFIGRAIIAKVCNSSTPSALIALMTSASEELMSHYNVSTIKERTGIAATRAAYKAAGKDPSRYRPACEQLCRRLLNGHWLYAVNTLVDIGNLVSVTYGYSTAVLDADNIGGKAIMLDIGAANEPYEAIGRGTLNIMNLPVYRDSIGAFATPTSDSTRTMVTETTRHTLFLINGYDGCLENINAATDSAISLLEQYAAAHIEAVVNY